MSFLKNKILFLLIFILIISVGMVFILWQNNPIVNYYVFKSDLGELNINDPVLIENIEVGYISDIKGSNLPKASYLIELHFDKEYSIPDKSIVEFNKSKNYGSFVNIKLIASKNYMEVGDTFNKPTSVVVIEVDSLKKDQTINAKNIENIISYKIQLISSKKKISINSAKFQGISDIEELFIDGYYKYYAGNAKTLNEAKSIRKNIINNGIPDAFVVAFKNGERISLKQALTYEK